MIWKCQEGFGSVILIYCAVRVSIDCMKGTEKNIYNGAEEMRIYTYPDPILRLRADPVQNIDADIRGLAERMLQIMYEAPGIGLAANQVGVAKRVIVFDLERKNANRTPGVLINPEVVLGEGDITWEESCLSVLDFSAEVTRSERVKVRGVNLNGKPLEIDAEGLFAVCLQHEIDHLDGILYIDHISSLKRAMYKKKLKKRLKRT